VADSVTIKVNGRPVTVAAGTALAVAIAQAGALSFRRSVSNEPRGPLCGMGVCLECRVTVNGQPHVRSCLTPCAEGMDVRTI
jgi:sarcosine oxidase subunit alpha